MTLVEMLVSVTILTVMILMFSSILVQSQQYISVAQVSRRSHALAFSIGRIFRRDLRRASQNGFLSITQNARGPMLIFTTAGTSQGIASNVTGSGSVVCYGMCRNQGSTRNVLWRAAYILRGVQPLSSGDVQIDKESIDLDFGQVQLMPREDLAKTPKVDSIKELCALLIGHSNPISVWVPPRKASEVEALWQVLLPECSGLSITWTDGGNELITGDLRWFGLDPEKADPARQINRCEDLGVLDIELPRGDLAGVDYCALWSHEKQKIWPKAVKVRFRTFDKALPKEFRAASGKPGLAYEIICNLGQ